MNYIYFFLINIVLISSINYVQYKLNFLLDINLKHKIKNKRKIALSGGIYILISLILCNNLNYIDIPIYIFFVLSLFFILGYFSDTQPNFVPILRLILQLILIILFLYYGDVKIDQSKIFFIDIFLSNIFFNILFTSLCIIVLLNGSNFIDGVNTNLIGYFLIVLFIISKFNYYFDVNYLIIIFVVFYILFR